jgi:hypothetical protein
MANYTKATNFTAKDSLLTGNPSKLIRGSEIDTEFNSIATAISTKADTNSPSFTGTPVAPTAPNGTNSTQLATTAFVVSQIGAIAAGVSSFSGGTTGLTPNTATSGAITLAGTLGVANGGTGRATLTSGSVLVGAGTAQVSLVAPGTAKNLLMSNGTTWTSSNPMIGWGQTWQDVSGSRLSNTTYTNSTGKPIMVNVYRTASDGTSAVSLEVLVGSTWIAVATVNPDINDGSTASAIVPDGSDYRFAGAFTRWTELR